MKLQNLLKFGVCLSLISGLEASRILAIFPTPSKSHWILEEPYLKALHAKGHDITVVSAFDKTSGTSNWTHISVPNLIHVFGGTSGLFSLSQGGQFLSTPFIFYMGSKLCEAYFQNENMLKLYNADEKYDVVIISTFWSECLLAYSYKFKAPVVGFATFSGQSWLDDIVGNPNEFSYIPVLDVSTTSQMTFFQRLYNTVLGLYVKMIRNFIHLPYQWSIVQKYTKDTTIPSLRELEKNMSVLFINNHFSIAFPRPLVPNLIEVAGLHLKPAKKLPQDLQKFLDNAKEGVIYFSLGSNLKSSEMPEEKRTAFLKAFARLKQQVLWKWEEEILPEQPSNVKLSKWFPQNDILGHKNIKIFITHGGLLSTQEAIYHSVPLVAIPVYGDQDTNARRMEEFGYGARVQFQNVTEESVYWAISEVLNNPRYKESVKRLSQLFHDRPRTPLEEAVYWTEYVLRHNGARHMRTAALDLTWYQYLLLDVAALVVAAATLIALFIFIMVRLIIKKFTSKGQAVETSVRAKKKSAKKQQ